MEGLAIVLALGALALSAGTFFVVMRRDQPWLDSSPGSARTGELERRLAQMSQRLEVVEAESDAKRGAAPDGERAIRTGGRGIAAISRIGLVRFDAFADAGGAQSFALALVDDDGDGIVLTSLHSRPTTRVYVKAIRRGVADAPLSGEEEQALRDAGISP